MSTKRHLNLLKPEDSAATSLKPPYVWLHGKNGKVFIALGGLWGALLVIGFKNGWRPQETLETLCELPCHLSREDSLSLGRILRHEISQARSADCPGRQQMKALLEQITFELLAGPVSVMPGPQPNDADLEIVNSKRPPYVRAM